MKYTDIDIIDFALGLLVIFIAWKFGILTIFITGILYALIYFLRRDTDIRLSLETDTKTQRLKALLPPEVETLPDPVLSAEETPTLYKTITQKNKISREINIDRIPEYVKYTSIPQPQTTFNVPIGIGLNQQGVLQWVWIDFLDNVVHGFVGGQTGTGKDALLKLWFMTLTAQNKPHELKFVILDGKGEWVIAPLINAQHMLVPPVGGLNLVEKKDKNGKVTYVDQSTEDMEQAIYSIYREITWRVQEFQKLGVSNIERYREKTGLPLPYIVIFATDIGSNLAEGEFEKLIRVLISKGRSYGIRLILSMQTASKQDTTWRSNVSLVVCGNVQNDSQDRPNMGMDVESMLFRPSKLPNPQKRPGMFVVRHGSDQYVVQSPHLPDKVFEQYINDVLPQKEKVRSLEELLLLPGA